MKFTAFREDGEVPEGFETVPSPYNPGYVDPYNITYQATDLPSIQSALDGEFDPAMTIEELLDMLGFSTVTILDMDGIVD